MAKGLFLFLDQIKIEFFWPNGKFILKMFNKPLRTSIMAKVVCFVCELGGKSAAYTFLERTGHQTVHLQ